MAFTRSLLTRLVEGLIRDFLANADVASYWETRVDKGPFRLSADMPIAQPQVMVLPTPGVQQIQPGVSGVQGRHTLSVVVGIFEPIANTPFEIGSNVIDPYDRMQLLKTIIIAGSDGNNQGKIIDPYNSTSTDPVQKYLNTDTPSFQDYPVAVVKSAAEFWSFRADFTTRISNITFTRA